ncbi:MAG TPA: hypothetical protein VHT73_09565 [Thermodesulfobacteriota bacterium]|nr:hypothetical protein [Thermodesulfobacteriota bacterium]
MSIEAFLNNNLIQYALKLVPTFFSKVKHSLITFRMENFSDLNEKVLSDYVAEGNCIESVGQFSMFGHIFFPPEIPIVGNVINYKISERLSNVTSGIVQRKAEMQLENIVYPVSTIPRLPVEDLHVGFIYPGQFDRFLSYKNPKNKVALSGIPVITKLPVWQFTEKFVEFNLTLMHLPYELLGDLLSITKEQYNQLAKEGRTVVLMDYLPGNYIRPREFGLDLEGDYYKRLDSLKATLFMSFHTEDMRLIENSHELINHLIHGDFITKCLKHERMNFIALAKNKAGGRRLLTCEKFTLDIQSSGIIYLAMPVDLVNDFFKTSKEFRILGGTIVKEICEFMGDERKLVLDFIYDFEGGLQIEESEILRGRIIEEIINNRLGLKRVTEWLRERYPRSKINES